MVYKSQLEKAVSSRDKYVPKFLENNSHSKPFQLAVL